MIDKPPHFTGYGNDGNYLLGVGKEVRSFVFVFVFCVF